MLLLVSLTAGPRLISSVFHSPDQFKSQDSTFLFGFGALVIGLLFGYGTHAPVRPTSVYIRKTLGYQSRASVSTGLLAVSLIVAGAIVIGIAMFLVQG